MKFSVIMPVYGVESYLRQSIDSVINQTNPDWELILVDDCSPDGCGAICDTYAEQDKRVRVIHKPVNEGLGQARNTGLSKADGTYVLFLDSDDFWEPDLLETVAPVMEQGVQIAVFGAYRDHEDSKGKVTARETLCPPAMVGTSLKDAAKIFLTLNDAHVFPFAWNKVYRRDFLEAFVPPFETTPLIEDFLYNIAAFGQVTHIQVIDRCFYHYRKPAHETLVSRYSPAFFDLSKRKFQLERSFLQTAGGYTQTAAQTIDWIFLKHVLSVFVRNRSKSSGLSGKQRREKIFQVLQDPLVKEVLERFRPESLAQRVICMMLRNRLARMCDWAAAGIAWKQSR